MNNFYGYKGNIKITVDRFYNNYSENNKLGSDENIGIVYNAYLDTSLEKKQTIIFHESSYIKELQIIVENEKGTAYYDKKKYLIAQWG